MNTRNDLNTPTAQRSGKHFATLQARAALEQVVLLQTTNDHEQPLYVASRWAMCKAFGSLDEVEVWLARVTGKPGAGSKSPGGACE